MIGIFWSFLARCFGRNSKFTPTSVISNQMNEPRSLPLGREEFDTWSDRIISGSILPADIDSQKFALANMLLHLGPTESHKPDAFFIHSLRKFAINQVADTIRKELHEKAKAKKEEDDAALTKAKDAAEETLARIAVQGTKDAQVLANGGVQES